ncbi:MAG: hypothetical protein A7316_08510 [Candidatus Altiarchaeales archaeon WOR_SM1_86-2]|nr:MAG: hypothetical protein A7316_08510 [Candidatus Altiarchaeales archaeon WOR_SM1_86-2]ODS41655.1 MAG: hypothetical protein A7315_00870 [Candidatus Altiarchaeales archaeon WOR_SM1_79]
MAEVVVKIPEDLVEEFKDIKPVFWQLVVDRAINEELARLRKLKQIVSKSKLTKKDVEELSDEVNKSLAERYVKLFA